MNKTPALSLALFAGIHALGVAQDNPLPVATLERDTPVDFAKEVVPFLKKNCFSCHNEKKAKADLNLESPQAMLAGGDSGPAIVPGNPMESLVFTYAAHLEDDPMPPAKNKSKAENLSANELGLLKLWIEQGAKGTSAAILAGPAEWQDLSKVHSIYAVAISDDGRFAAAGRGNRLSIYDLRTGALAAELLDSAADMKTAHRDSIHSLAFSRDGVLASGGFRTVKLWQRHVNPPARLGHSLPEAATAIAASADGAWVAMGDAKGNLALKNLASSEKPPAARIHTATVRAILFAPAGQFLFSTSDDKSVVRAALPELKETRKVDLPAEGLSLALLEGGAKLAVGGADGIIRVLPATSFDPLPEGASAPPPLELKGHSGKVIALRTLDEAGTQLLSASEDGTARIWDLTGKELRKITHGSAIAALDLHRGTNRVATAGADGVVRLWDSTNGNKAGELTGDLDFEVRRKAATRKRDLAKRIAEKGKKDLADREKKWNELKEKSKTEAGKIAAALKDLEAKAAVAKTRRTSSEQKQREIAALEAAKDDGALGKAKGEAKKIDEELKKADGELANAERAYDAAIRNSQLAIRDAVKAGERYLSIQADSTDADAALAVAEEAVKAIEGEAANVGVGALRSVSFSPDGKTLAVSAEKAGVRLWSATTFQPLDTVHAGPGTGLLFTAKGTLVAALPDKSLASWASAVTWSKVRQLGEAADPAQFPDRVLALAFHPRGHLLATGSGIPSRSSQLKFWRVRDGYLEGAIEKAHQDTITGLAFSPDGARIASSSTDRFVKIHQVETAELVEQLEGHTNHVLDVAWSADGGTIASAGADHVAKLWVAAEGRQSKTEAGFKKELTAIAFLGTGDGLLIGSGDKIVKAAGQNLGGVQDFVYDVAASPDGATIVAGGEAGVLRVWQASDRKLLHSFAPSTPTPTETAAR